MRFWDLLSGLRSARHGKTSEPQSPTQPVPNVTFADVQRIVSRDFPPDKVGEITTLLDEYGKEKWQTGAARVRLAALKLANGDVGKLRIHIQAAQRDYRDVLASAEYPAYMKAGLRIRELSNEERRRIIDADWQQYDKWLGR